MMETGSPARRPGWVRPALLGVIGLGILGGGAWLAYRQVDLRAGERAAGTPRVTPASLVVPTAPASASAKTAPAVAAGAEAAGAQAARKQAGGADAAPAATASTGKSGGGPVAPVRPSFDIVRVGPGGSAVVAGRAEPDADVALLDNGHVIARATADDSGQFVVIPDKPLPAGGQQLALESRQAGAAPVTGDTPAVLVVPDRPDDTGGVPTEARSREAPGDTRGSAVAVLTPPDAAPRLLTVPSDPAGAPGHVQLRVVDYDSQGAIRFAGTARPGAAVRVYIDNKDVGEATADAQGHWGLVPGDPVAAGQHHLRADELGVRGQVESRVELPFRRVAFAADEAHGGQVVVQPRQSLWRIAREIYGHGTRYTVIYAANRDQIRDPNRIYPGQVFTLPKAGTATASGNK